MTAASRTHIPTNTQVLDPPMGCFVGSGANCMTKADDRAAMIDGLNRIAVPALRARGFSGSFPHFRRVLEDRTDLVTFQFDHYGGGFVVEIAKCPPGKFETALGEQIAPNKLTAHHLHPSQRRRLGAPDAGQDHWFRYDGAKGRQRQDIFDSLAEHVSELLGDRAESWFEAA